MYQDSFFNELIVDNFAGGGGASVGIELAQGFPKDYIINIEPFIGKRYSKAKQIARLGNAVCPPMATALIRANCPELCYKVELRTVAELEKAILRSVV